MKTQNHLSPNIKCQVSVERIVLDLDSKVMRGPGSTPTGNNILSLNLFHIVKPLMPILALLPSSSNFCENLECLGVFRLGFLPPLEGLGIIMILIETVP